MRLNVILHILFFAYLLSSPCVSMENKSEGISRYFNDGKILLTNWSPELAGAGCAMLTFTVNHLQDSTWLTSLFCSLIAGIGSCIFLRNELNIAKSKEKLLEEALQDEDIIRRYHFLLAHHMLMSKAIGYLASKHKTNEIENEISSIKRELAFYINNQYQYSPIAGMNKQYLLTLITSREYHKQNTYEPLEVILQKTPKKLIMTLISENMLQENNIQAFKKVQKRNCSIIQLFDIYLLSQLIRKNIPIQNQCIVIDQIKEKLRKYITREISDTQQCYQIKKEFEKNLDTLKMENIITFLDLFNPAIEY